MNTLSQIDDLMESDILDALETKSSQKELENTQDIINIEDFEENYDDESINIEDYNDEESKIQENQDETCEEKVKVVQQVNTNEIATLLSQLLNNKTIEITIKIKD